MTPEIASPGSSNFADILVTIDTQNFAVDDPTVKLTHIVSTDELTADDLQNVDFGTDDREFSLRAPASGEREYTILYDISDDAGNTLTAEADLVVKGDE